MARMNRHGPQPLAIVRLHGVEYFIDTDLSQFREVENPYNFIDFDTEIGQQMWSECHITECPNCGIDNAVWHHEDGESRVCSWCGCSSVVRARRLEMV